MLLLENRLTNIGKYGIIKLEIFLSHLAKVKVGMKNQYYLGFLAVVVLSGCATDDPNRRAKTGAALGAVIGGIAGHQMNSDKGRFVGAVVGAVGGAAVGNYMDKQQKEFDQALQKEQQDNAVEIERLKDDTLKLSLNSQVSFDFDSARIKPTFEPTLNRLAEVLKTYDKTIVHVVGFTDNKGTTAYNLDLSKRRAEAVVGYLDRNGVSGSRLRVEGRGESEPRDTNATEAGRQLNRRVEIFVKPVVEGNEQKAQESPKG